MVGSSILLLWKINAQEARDTIGFSVEIPDVVVTAQYAPTDSKNAVFNVRTIDQANIARRGITNLEQLLQQELNIRISQDLILGSSFQLQGLSGQNVKILVDGIPVSGRAGDNIDLGQVNLFNVEKVEIVEGPVSAFYGSDALGGVINLITKKSQSYAWDAGGTIQVEKPGARQANARIGWRPWQPLLILLNGGRYQFDGYNTQSLPDSTYTRTYQWNPKKQWFSEAAVRWNPAPEQSLRYAFSVFNENIDNLGPIKRPQFKPYAFDDQYQTRRFNHHFYYEGRQKERWYYTLDAAFQTYQRQKYAWQVDLTSDQRIPIIGSQDTTQFQSLILKSTTAFQPNNKSLTFFGGILCTIENGRGPRLEDPASPGTAVNSIGDYALFVSGRYSVNAALTLQADARGAYNTKFKAPLSPALHVKYRFTPTLSLRASYARGFRSPTLKELYFYFVDANHYIIGNPALQPERSNNAQATLTWEKTSDESRRQFSIGAFYNHVLDKIDLYDFIVVNGQKIPAADLDTFSVNYAYFNADVFRSFGGNFRGSLQKKRWEARLGWAPTAWYNPLHRQSPSTPAYTFTNELNGELSWLFARSKLRISSFSRYNDKLTRFYLTTDAEGNAISAQSVQQGYLITDVTASISLWRDRIQLMTGIRNLFNVRNPQVEGAYSGNNNAHSGTESNIPASIGRVFFAKLTFQRS